jgi:hypothetical protein
VITLEIEKEPAAASVMFSDNQMSVNLTDGRGILIPLEWYPRLLHATADERKNWQLLGNGYAIEWLDLDEHIGIEGLLAGHRSGESQKSLDQWLCNRNQ